MNQYISLEVPGYLGIIGSVNSNATVLLWTDHDAWAQTERHGDYFHGELAVNNATNALWLTITNVAAMQDSPNPDIVTNIIGRKYVARTPENFSYDLDGNLTTDGQWNYTWDAENRLIKVAAKSTVGPQIALALDYDFHGRRLMEGVNA